MFPIFWTQIAMVIRRPMNIATGIVFPWLFLALMTFQRLDSLEPAIVTAAFSSSILAALWSAAIWSAAGVLRREIWTGMMASTFTARYSPTLLTAVKTGAAMSYDMALILIASFSFLKIFGLSMIIAQPLAFVLGLIAVFIGGGAASMLLGSAVILSRRAFYLTAAAGPPLLLLGGFVIPVDLLPAPIRYLSAVINLRWLRDFLVSTASQPQWSSLAIGVALSAVYVGLAHRAIGVLLHRAKVVGSLEL
ncbi:ABC transporter permease [Corynebacterium mustelae]|nr:ABC transporter permease [Corynebacterium mustelae]